jgi:hypothetical protein
MMVLTLLPLILSSPYTVISYHKVSNLPILYTAPGLESYHRYVANISKTNEKTHLEEHTNLICKKQIQKLYLHERLAHTDLQLQSGVSPNVFMASFADIPNSLHGYIWTLRESYTPKAPPPVSIHNNYVSRSTAFVSDYKWWKLIVGSILVQAASTPPPFVPTKEDNHTMPDTCNIFSVYIDLPFEPQDTSSMLPQ